MKRKKKLTKKELDILEFCAPHWKYMWSAVIIGKILECDYRDSGEKVKEVLNEQRK